MSGARLEGSTLVVRIRMRFQRRGGRKRIMSPTASAVLAAAEGEADAPLELAGRAHSVL